GRDGRGRGLRRRRRVRALGGRLPPRLRAPAAPGARAEAHRGEHRRPAVGEAPRRGVLRRDEQLAAVRRSPRPDARLRRLRPHGPPRVRRAVHLLAVLLHHRDQRVGLAAGLRLRRLHDPALLQALGPDAVARQGHRLPVTAGLGRRSRLRPTLPGRAGPAAALPLLAAELDKLDAWRALLPPNASPLVALRELDTLVDTLVLHPVGTLEVTQRLVPLGESITKLGNAKATDLKRAVLEVDDS